MPSDNSAARTAILDAAERLFAKRGFEATTIKDIGAAAGVNSALLYYYFDDKETLYREMLRRCVGWFVGEVGPAVQSTLEPENAVRALIEAQAVALAKHPHLPRLLVREMVDHDARHAESAITQLLASLFERLCAEVRTGQESGVFRADLSPRFAAISIIAQVAYLHVARPAVGILLGYGTAGPPDDVMTSFGQHAATFALGALRSAPAEPMSRSTVATTATAAPRPVRGPRLRPRGS